MSFTPLLSPSMITVHELSATEQGKIIRILLGSAQIKLHSELFIWLQGELQHFLPHDILIVISGNFAAEDLSFDVVSALPSVRTDNLLHCDMQSFSRQLYRRWQSQNRKMFSANLADGQCLNSGCTCEHRNTICQMKSVLVHGIRDKRSGHDAMYVLMHNASHDENRYRSMLELMMPHIDVAAQRIPHLPLACARTIAATEANRELIRIGISAREQEIIEWVTMGKTNPEIGMILNISSFTVKNHLQRIFKKLDVLNRVSRTGIKAPGMTGVMAPPGGC